MYRPERYFRARLAVLITGGALIAALFPMAGVALAAVPAAPSTPDLVAASDTGTSSTDNYTSDTTPTFTVDATAGITVKLYSDATQTNLAGTGTANMSGVSTITSSVLTPGTYSFTATAFDASTGTSLPSGALSVTIDTAVPAAPSAPDLAAASDSGLSSTDNITNVTTPLFTGTAAAGSVVELFAGSTSKGKVTANGSGAWSITSTALTAGTYSFTATATNLAGTSLASSPLSVTIYTALSVTIEQAVSQADPTGTSPINFAVVFSQPVTGFVTGNLTLTSGTAGGSKTAVITGTGTTYNVAVYGMTTPGTVVASIAASVISDAAGNPNAPSTSADNIVTWDPSAGPSVTINQAVGQVDPTAAAPINFTVVFSAPVSGFDSTDVALASTAGSVYAIVTAASTSVYNVAVYGMSVSGTVTASVAADRAVSITGNHPNLASTSTDNSVTFRVASKFIVTSSSYAPVPGSGVTITAQLTDSLNLAVPVSGVVVTWSSTGGGTFSAATSTTNASGIATVTFTVSATNGTVHAVTATGGGFTGTSTNITVSANPATISLTRSHGMITYGETVTFSVQFGTGGSTRPVVIEYTSVGVPWTTIGNLITNTSGFASLTYAPTRTGYVRARFAGTTDLGAATSTVYIVGVRQTVSTLSPHHAGTTAIARGTSVTFSTRVRPLRMDLAPTMVTFRFYQKVSGAWVLKNERHVATDTSGVARTTFTFSSRGGWYVRAYAPRTPYNSITRFTLREYYLVL